MRQKTVPSWRACAQSSCDLCSDFEKEGASGVEEGELPPQAASPPLRTP